MDDADNHAVHDVNTIANWRRLSAEWRVELNRRIELLQRLSRELDLRNAWDELSEEGSGPRLLEPTLRKRHARQP